MTKGRNRLRLLTALAAGLVTMFLLSGCLWGVVKDAETGAPIPGASVTYTDVNGATGTATADANGIYVFDQAAGPYPARGPASFEVTAPGYEPLTAARLIEYNDNPNATLTNLSTFWEAQGFNLTKHLVPRIAVELQAVDVDQATPPPPTRIWYRYIVGIQVFDPADPATPICQQLSPWFDITVADPPPQTLDFHCLIPGDDVLAKVIVGLLRVSGPPNTGSWTHGSIAAFDWLAPAPNTDWAYATLDSTDAAGPDDNANIRFQASIRYKAIEGPEVLPSDVNRKENFGEVDTGGILQKLVALPLTTWNYIGESASIRHLGPMAQDFYAAFGLGKSDLEINPIDAQGVAFAAIQELFQMVIKQKAQIDALQNKVADLTARIAALEEKLGAR